MNFAAFLQAFQRFIVELTKPVPPAIPTEPPHPAYVSPLDLLDYIRQNPCSWKGVFTGGNTSWWAVLTGSMDTSAASEAGYSVRYQGQANTGDLFFILYGPPTLPSPTAFGRILGSGVYDAANCQNV